MNEEYKCCNKAHLVKAYITCYPFSAKLCLNCGEAISNMHPIVEWIFHNILGLFWNGTIKIDYKNLTEEEKKIFEENFGLY